MLVVYKMLHSFYRSIQDASQDDQWWPFVLLKEIKYRIRASHLMGEIMARGELSISLIH